MKEYEMILDDDLIEEFSSALYILHASLDKNCWQYIKLEELKEMTNKTFNLLYLKKRYYELEKLSNDKLYASLQGFYLDTHIFQTLDEVEKALNNKAFL